MSEVIHLTPENFDEVISKGVCLVDFWAKWCGPCKMLSPVIDEIAAEIGDSAVIAKADVEEVPQGAAKFAVRMVPTIFVLRDGAIIKQFSSVQDKATLLAAIQNA